MVVSIYIFLSFFCIFVQMFESKMSYLNILRSGCLRIIVFITYCIPNSSLYTENRRRCLEMPLSVLKQWFNQIWIVRLWDCLCALTYMCTIFQPLKPKAHQATKISFLSFPLQHFRDNSILNCLVFRLTVAVIVCRMLRTNNVLCRMSGTKDETLVSRKPVSV